MSRLSTFTCIGVLALVVGGVFEPNAAAADQFTDEYGVVVQNNVFLRQRGAVESNRPSSTSRPSVPPRSPEQSLMLTGVVFEDGEYRAYFEDLSAGSVLRVLTGDAIARGIVADIALNAVAYRAADGKIQWVDVGQDLTGTDAIVTTQPNRTGTGAPTTQPSSTVEGGSMPSTADAAGQSDPSTMSIRERMMLRRQESLQRNQGQ